MAFKGNLLSVVMDEWKRWGFSIRPLGGLAKIGGRERESPFVSFVNDYWKAVNQPAWNGNTAQPWSAAFISFCFKTAGAGKEFPYNQGHAGYCRSILKSPQKFSMLAIADPATTTVDATSIGRSVPAFDVAAITPPPRHTSPS